MVLVDGDMGEFRCNPQYDRTVLINVPNRMVLERDVWFQAGRKCGTGIAAIIRAQTLFLTDFHHFKAGFHAGRKKKVIKSRSYSHLSTPLPLYAVILVWTY